MTDEQMKYEIAQIYEGLPGFDTRTALDRLGGSPAIYISFLSRFYDEYGGIGDKLTRLLSENELCEAHRLVHSVKSLAGNLGAEELRLAAVGLEADMQRGAVMPSQDTVDSFQGEFSLVLNELNAFIHAREVS